MIILGAITSFFLAVYTVNNVSNIVIADGTQYWWSYISNITLYGYRFMSYMKSSVRRKQYIHYRGIGPSLHMPLLLWTHDRKIKLMQRLPQPCHQGSGTICVIYLSPSVHFSTLPFCLATTVHWLRGLPCCGRGCLACWKPGVHTNSSCMHDVWYTLHLY